MTSQVRQAAWVPAEPYDPERASRLCVTWILQEARERRAAPLLLTPERRVQKSGPQAIRSMADQYEATTPRGNRPTVGQRSVLAYVPDYPMVALAMAYAADSSLAIVEYPSYPLRGWAIEVGAIDLTTGELTADVLTESQREGLDHLLFAGNNGWSDVAGKRDANRILSEMHERGEFDKGLVFGYCLAHGRGRSLDTLAKIARGMR